MNPLAIAKPWILAIGLLVSCWAAVGQESSEPPAKQDEAQPSPAATASAEVKDDRVSFYIIPVQGAIGQPTLFAVRNGVKDAISMKADIIILDMDTPGGELGATLEIMKILERFEGEVATFINQDAISAGSFIAASTEEIWFAPQGVIGAAAPITGQGQDLNETLRLKIISYLKARIRAMSEEYRYRGEVISAMVDENVELVIDGEVLKEKGTLLSLTAQEAIKLYGDPPVPLLGEGIADSIEDLMGALAEGEEYKETRFQSTWSLDLARFIVSVAPFLFAVGIMSIYIEMQTPGFGIPGIIGVCCFLVAMFGHHVAGLSGNEPMLFFVLGVVLVFVEVFFFPGIFVLAIPGLLLMVASLIWSMVDVWPEGTPGYEIEPGMFVEPIVDLGLGVLLALVGMALLFRFLPKSMVRNRMILTASIAGTSQGAPAAALEGAEDEATRKPRVGDEAVASSDLFPSGQIDFNGRQYEARSESGSLERGARVRITAKTPFGFVVEEVKS